MKFVRNDGGRAAAGFSGSTGDCVTRAIAIATGLPYKEVYDAMAEGNATQRKTKRMRKSLQGKRTARHGIYTGRKWFKEYLTKRGWVWTPTMFIGQGCKVHLNEDELPKGRLIVAVSRHMTAVIDGVIHDTYNPSEDRGVTIYPDTTPVAKLPKKARKLSTGGWAYEPERCVYGYWSKPGEQKENR